MSLFLLLLLITILILFGIAKWKELKQPSQIKRERETYLVRLEEEKRIAEEQRKEQT